MIPFILIHILIFDEFSFLLLFIFLFHFFFSFCIFIFFVGARWKSSFLLGVSSLRWLESPKVSWIQDKGSRTKVSNGDQKRVCVCV